MEFCPILSDEEVSITSISWLVGWCRKLGNIILT